MIVAELMIEAQSNSAAVARDELRKLVQRLRAERGVRLRREDFAEPELQEGLYSCIVELEVEFESLKEYLMCSLRYAPSAVYLRAPEGMKVSAKELLEALGLVIKNLRALYTTCNLRFNPSQEYEPQVGLEDYEIDELLEEGAIHAKIVAEVAGRSGEEALKALVGDIAEEAAVSRAKWEPSPEGRGRYLVGVDAYVNDACSLLSICIRYVPLMVQILEPEVIKISMGELQDMGVELAGLALDSAHMLLSQD
ncbi:MAG: hypothetical protein GXN98_04690 [Euryarchaeota archaeon]|nr:hypothetical protein [Euryarchaeota archaeon]